MSTTEEHSYLTPEEFAERYRVSRSAVYKACRAGRIRGAKKVLGLWRIPTDALDDDAEDAVPSDETDPMPRPRRGRSDSLRSRVRDSERRRK